MLLAPARHTVGRNSEKLASKQSKEETQEKRRARKAHTTATATATLQGRPGRWTPGRTGTGHTHLITLGEAS